MPNMITQSGLYSNHWTPLDVDQTTVSTENTLVPFSTLEQIVFDIDKSALGVSVENDVDFTDSDTVRSLLEFGTIALNFPKYVDGRAYSQARLLRERYGYQGNILATGDVLRDQLYYMFRCGFTVFALRDDQDAEASMAAFNEFTVQYQNSVEQPTPLFLRR